MSNKFDELAKGMAESVTRRGALKKFGLGLGGIVLSILGVTRSAKAGGRPAGFCEVDLYTRTLTGSCVFKARKVKVPCPRGSGNCWTEVCDEKISYDCSVGLAVDSVSSDLDHCSRPYTQIACG